MGSDEILDYSTLTRVSIFEYLYSIFWVLEGLKYMSTFDLTYFYMLMCIHLVSGVLVCGVSMEQKLCWITNKINPLIATMDFSNGMLE